MSRRLTRRTCAAGSSNRTAPGPVCLQAIPRSGGGAKQSPQRQRAIVRRRNDIVCKPFLPSPAPGKVTVSHRTSSGAAGGAAACGAHGAVCAVGQWPMANGQCRCPAGRWPAGCVWAGGAGRMRRHPPQSTPYQLTGPPHGFRHPTRPGLRRLHRHPGPPHRRVEGRALGRHCRYAARPGRAHRPRRRHPQHGAAPQRKPCPGVPHAAVCTAGLAGVAPAPGARPVRPLVAGPVAGAGHPPLARLDDGVRHAAAAALHPHAVRSGQWAVCSSSTRSTPCHC